MFPYMPTKPPRTMADRILRALAAGPAHSQAELAKDAKVEFAELRLFNEAMDFALAMGEVIETKRQVPGTGHEGPPVFEYTYSLPRVKS